MQSLIDNGIFSAIPYLAYAIVALSSGQVADFLRRNGLSTVIVRKMFTTLCENLPSVINVHFCFK